MFKTGSTEKPSMLGIASPVNHTSSQLFDLLGDPLLTYPSIACGCVARIPTKIYSGDPKYL